MHKNKIRIKNFGPIKEGYTDSEDGFFAIEKITVLLGEQASGKSCIAKLISSLLWTEKSLLREDWDKKNTIEIISSADFFYELFDYHNITGYFTDKTEIDYYAQNYKFIIRGKSLSAEKYLNTIYEMPKIMYIPAERNVLSALKNPQSIVGLSAPLYTLLEEYENACHNLKDTNFSLPLEDIYLTYDNDSKTAVISDKDAAYKIYLYQAASGIQSLVPMMMVSNFLAGAFAVQARGSHRELSLNYAKKINKACLSLLIAEGLIPEQFSNSLLREVPVNDVSLLPKSLMSLLKAAGIMLKAESANDISFANKLREALSCYYTSFFYNIVEEPEQNLFPTAQKMCCLTCYTMQMLFLEISFY